MAERAPETSVTVACIMLVVGAAVTTIPAERFTLAWTHSIEKLRWEEDYVLGPQGLAPVAARIRGSGAGMEIPEGAVLRNGVWHYVPQRTTLPALLLARSAYVADYELCWDGSCRTIAQMVPRAASDEAAEIRPCR